MYRVSRTSNQPPAPSSPPSALWLAPILVLTLSACKGLPTSPQAEVNCAERCPCECKCDQDKDDKDDKGDKGDKGDKPLPTKNEPYPVFLAGNVVIAEGSMPLEQARERIVSERISLERCYSDALKKDTSIKGEMNVQFTVSAPTGQVIASVVRSSTLKDASAIERCLTDRIRAWTFDPHKGTTEAVVRFDVYMSGVTFESP